LAGMVISIISFVFGIYFYNYGGTSFSPYAYVSFAILGSIIGFLRYNLHKAIIFMGDTGSLVCGFIVAVLAIQFVEMKTVPNAPSIAVAILIIPLLDTVRVFILRILAGMSPFSADKNHIHHRLISLGLSQLNTVLVLGLLNLIAIILSIYFSYLDSNTLLGIILTYALFYSIIIEWLARKRKVKIDANA
jgi:UDP-GlcNAc:undecaprenyl-phosphate/decaprenyl-phosphate GlcNAc-1-phosphate transferase